MIPSVRSLLRCGMVAGPVFVGTFLLAGARRPGYDPMRHPVSSLALGRGGWVQTTNFAVAGALYAAGSVGLEQARRTSAHRSPVPIMVAAAGIGLLGSAAFTTDPVSGYPPGTPDLHTGYGSATAALHDVSAVPIFLGLSAVALVEAWAARRNGDRWWATYSAGSAAMMLIGFGLASAGFAQAARLVRYGGLLQRISAITALGWLTAVFARSLRSTHDAGATTGR